MRRRHFLKTLGLGAAAAGLPVSPLSAAPAKDLPNIVLILADDMGFSDPGCFGSEINTPNLDRLAKGGIRFTQFYNTAKCFPSRACLLTGVYAQQCGMARGFAAIKNAVTIGEVLRTAGYRTLWTGKHHCNENPFDRGFDRYFGLRDGACNYFNPGNQREGEPMPARKRVRNWCIDGKHMKPYTPKEKDFYATDYFTKYALGYLDEYKNEKKPFFLYLAYNAPHDPLHAWPEDIAKYKGKYMAGYKTIRDARYKKQMDMGLFRDNAPLSPQTSAKWDSLSEEKKKEEDLRMAVYAAMVDSLDQNIGKVLDKIKELGEEENTLVFFCSDNGASAEVVKIGKGEIGTMTRWSSQKGDWANVSNTPFRKFKTYSHEGGICNPLIAYWPKKIKKPGSICREPGHFIDFMATFVDITGAAYPKAFKGQNIVPLQGKSMLPLFEAKPRPERPPLFWQWSAGKAVRAGKWKLVSWGKKKKGSKSSSGGAWELYDMEKDRTELNDLSGKHPEKVEELSKMWEAWLKNCAS